MSLIVAYLTAWSLKWRRLMFSNERGFGKANRVSPVVRDVVRIDTASNDETRRADGVDEMLEREDAPSETELEDVADEVAEDQESVDEASPRRSRLRDVLGVG